MNGLPCGLIVVDKPSGPTSQDVVRKAKHLLRVKVGHTGTLDPLATGVLPLVVGRATRLSRFFQVSDKEYLAEVRLGLTTETLDREGRVLERNPVPQLDERRLEEVLEPFRGEVRQQAPAYSAVRVGGRRLYQLARSGRSVERPWRSVQIYRLQLAGWTADSLRLQVHCSSGTYVRVLAHEIGQRLGCGACLTDLRRLRCGSLDLGRAVELAALEQGWRQALQPVEQLLPEWPRIDLGEQQARRVMHGNSISPGGREARGPCRLFHGERLLAVAEMDASGRIQPTVVLAVPGPSVAAPPG